MSRYAFLMTRGHIVCFFFLFVLLLSGCDNNKASYFQKIGKLEVPVNNSTATILKDGTILIVGSPTIHKPFSIRLSKSAQIFDPKTGRATVIAPVHRLRDGHEAQLLNDGRVLLFGGHVTFNSPNDPFHKMVAEIYDPKQKSFTPIFDEQISKIAEDGKAIKLSNGKILIFAYYTKAIVEFDPTTDTFRKVGNYAQKRDEFSVILLPNDKVMMIGDHLWLQEDPFQRFEIYDVANKSSRVFGKLYANNPFLNDHPAVVVLKTGKVLVSYNEPIYFENPKTLESTYQPSPAKLVEIDVEKEQVTNVAQTPLPKVLPDAVLLPDGTVLFPGRHGYAEKWWSKRVEAFELYDPKTKTLKPIGSLPDATMPIVSPDKTNETVYLLERTPENPQKIFIFDYKIFKEKESEKN